MRDALHVAGRPVVFSICEWGGSRPWEWAGDVGHLWRTTGDITDCYDCIQRWERGWKVIVDLQYSLVQPHDGQNNGIGQFAGPDRWNDPDMLEVGNAGLSVAESRAHFSFWCILAAPLMAGNDVRHMSPEIRAIMTDREAIAINQDPLGRQGWRFRAEHGREIWVRELSGGDWALALLNTGAAAAELSVDFGHMWFLGGTCAIRDVWDRVEAGTTAQPFRKRLDSHDVALLRLKPAR
jgi:alpha-galactosidase